MQSPSSTSPTLWSAYMQDVMWRLFRFSRELVGTVADLKLCYYVRANRFYRICYKYIGKWESVKWLREFLTSLSILWCILWRFQYVKWPDDCWMIIPKVFWRSGYCLINYTGFYLEWLRKTTKHLIQNNWNWNQVSPEYESIGTAMPARSVKSHLML
jgi:hypothetical protein